MNGSDFVLVADGWVQISPLGEFKHAGAGVTQVIDLEACDRIAADFSARKSEANFPGVLVDFDHFSLDTEKSSEAAGWITDHADRERQRHASQQCASGGVQSGGEGGCDGVRGAVTGLRCADVGCGFPRLAGGGWV